LSAFSRTERANNLILDPNNSRLDHRPRGKRIRELATGYIDSNSLLVTAEKRIGFFQPLHRDRIEQKP
jgi:hypothetical protein